MIVVLGLVVTILMEGRSHGWTVAIWSLVLLAIPMILLDSVIPARSYFADQVALADNRLNASRQISKEVVSRMGGRCAILQLPYMHFPEASPRNALGVYDPLWLGLGDSSLNWSYGGIAGSAQDDFLARVSAAPWEHSEELADMGFCGVLVDTRGYESNELRELVSRLETAFGPAETLAAKLDGLIERQILFQLKLT